MVLESTGSTSFEERSLLHLVTASTCRPNLLIVCPRGHPADVITGLARLCVAPQQWWAPPGAMRLPPITSGSLIVRGIEHLTLAQQIALYDWMTAAARRDVQVVSVAGQPLWPLVEEGQFLEGLCHRLSVVRFDATSVSARRYLK